MCVIGVFQDCYPERLGKLYIVHAPKVFMAVWKIIYPFIDDNTKTKVSARKHFVICLCVTFFFGGRGELVELITIDS